METHTFPPRVLLPRVTHPFNALNSPGVSCGHTHFTHEDLGAPGSFPPQEVESQAANQDPSDTKAHPLSTVPARRHGKGSLAGRHSECEGPEAGRSDVQRYY